MDVSATDRNPELRDIPCSFLKTTRCLLGARKHGRFCTPPSLWTNYIKYIFSKFFCDMGTTASSIFSTQDNCYFLLYIGWGLVDYVLTASDSGGIRRLMVRKIHLTWKTIQNAYHTHRSNPHESYTYYVCRHRVGHIICWGTPIKPLPHDQLSLQGWVAGCRHCLDTWMMIYEQGDRAILGKRPKGSISHITLCDKTL